MNTVENFYLLNDEHATQPRREFLVQAASMLGLAASAGAALTLVSACETTVVKAPATTGGGGTGGGTASDNVVNIAQEPNLQNIGGAVVKTISSNQLVIIRASNADFLVLSATCTHQGCTVDLPSGGTITCQCHGSSFSATTGQVLNGPAGTPLRRYSSVFDSGKNTLTIVI